MTLRDLPFIHRFHEPEGVEAPEETYILLHGTGGDESGRPRSPAAACRLARSGPGA